MAVVVYGLCGFLLVWLQTTVANNNIIFEIKEEQQPPVVLGNIASKAGIKSIPDLDFSLLTRKDLFEVDESSGDFRTRTVLDRENLCGPVPRCVLTASVAVSSAPDFFQRYTVSVVVLDVNDKKPVFSTASFPRSLSERAEVNATFKLPVATDGDYEPLFKVQGYHLEPASQTTFALTVHKFNNSDGSVEFDLHLRLLHKIDREAVDSYTLTLVASDGGWPPNEGRQMIMISVLDENDNKPEFQKSGYDVSVKEVTPVGTMIVTVSAADADDGENGRVGYDFSSEVDKKALQFFEIDRSSGGVKLIRSLESEGGSTFSLKVKAFDHGTPMMFSETPVTVFVEDTVNNPPVISISQWRAKNDTWLVSEDVVPGTKVALIDVLDTDSGSNGETSCTTTSDLFTLKAYSNPGVYTISVSRDLDREKAATHAITIKCTDKGTPPLSSTAQLLVVVEDVNDNRPIFTRTSYEMTILENEESGVLVGNVFATDIDDGANAEIRYRLDSSVTQFEINEFNGYIYTSAKDLNREVQDKYLFEVYAFDTGVSPLTSTATVIVNIADMNDESPRFANSSYTFLVSESVDNNTVIGQVQASDLDLGLGGEVEYLLVHSHLHPDPPFSLSQKSGRLTVTRALDYETTKLYHFIIIAADLGSPPRNSSVGVQIQIGDENDNAPMIVFPSKDNFSVTLNLQVAPGHEVVRVMALDLDTGENGRLTYSIGNSNSETTRLFWINEDTGLLTLTAPLTEEDARSYNVVISVRDNGVPRRVVDGLLQLEIVRQAPPHSTKVSYTIIVIIIVCSTLFIVAVILIIFCSIWYLDNRKFCSSKSGHNLPFDPINKEHSVNFSDECDVQNLQYRITPNLCYQKQNLTSEILRFPAKPAIGKKSVTFDKALRTSVISVSTESISRDPNVYLNSSDPKYTTTSSSGSQGILCKSYVPNTFRSLSSGSISRSPSHHIGGSPTSSRTQCPRLSPSLLTTSNQRDFRDVGPSENGRDSNTDFLELGAGVNLGGMGRCQGLPADQMIDVALEKHNALVRSIRNHEKTTPNTGRKTSTRLGGYDLDLCSSSSVETSDSGHGGSEVDISVSKVKS